MSATTSEFDEYRVSLFKKKIRDLVPKWNWIRFVRSNGRCSLIIEISRHFYPRSESAEVANLVMGRLRENGIEFKPYPCPLHELLYPGIPKEDVPVSYVSIPIDQAALPERKRGYK